MSDYHGKYAGTINFAQGAISETAKQCGIKSLGQIPVGGLANKAGHKLIVALVPAGAAVVAAAPAIAMVAGVAAAGYGIYRLGKWLTE